MMGGGVMHNWFIIVRELVFCYFIGMYHWFLYLFQYHFIY